MLTFKQFKSYLRFVLFHKYYVFVYGKKINLSFWRALTHDASKFTPKEFLPYAKTFYSKTGEKQYEPTLAFDFAWLCHQKSNKHHHQFWVLQCDDGGEEVLPMQESYVKEMIADWASVSFILHQKDGLVTKWFHDNQHKMKLHSQTVELIEKYLKMLEG